MTKLKVLSVASEIFPLVKTGGLADVAGALPGALSHENIQATTLAPGYPGLIAKLDKAEPAHRYGALFGGPATVLAAKAGELDLFVLDAPHLFTRAGNLYLGPDGLDWPDNAERFAALARVAAEDRQRRGDQLARPISSMPMIGRRRWRRPIFITTADNGPEPSSRFITLPFRAIFPPTCSPPSPCRPIRSSSTASNILAGSGF